MPTTSQKIAADVAALLRARNPLLWVVTGEEARVEGHLIEAAAAAGYTVRFWDVAQGVTKMDAGRVKVEPDVNGRTPEMMRSPDQVLATIAERAQQNPDRRGERCVWVLRDLHEWIGNGMAGAAPLRQLKNLAKMLPSSPRECAQAVIVLTSSTSVPREISNNATVVEWPLPDREEIAALLDGAIAGLPEEMQAGAAPNGTRDAAIDAALGLSGEEAQACYAKSLVQTRRIDPAAVAGEKRRVIAKEQVLTWYDPLPGGLDAVGGLENLKGWLATRRNAYTPEARAYGLPAPKGAFLVGVPGCGKSLTAKAVATAWGVPLLRLDLAGLRSKFVGESEGKIRKALQVIDTIGRCVVWLDEVEKALQGATSGSADGGVSSDALGTILSWMQERRGEAFIIATANDVESLPPELLRKGRFDDVWFVDLPTAQERNSILLAALRSHGRQTIDIPTMDVARACSGFTGSEVAELVPDAMYRAFGDGARAITPADLLAAVQDTVPLGKTAPKKISDLREWANGRARSASASETSVGRKVGGRDLDL